MKKLNKENIKILMKIKLGFVFNPNDNKECLEAVKEDGNSIQFIDSPSEEVQLEAVKQDSESIRYIKNPSEKVQLVAVKQDGYSIQFIDNPSKKVILETINNSYNAIDFIDAALIDDEIVEYYLFNKNL